MQLRYGILFGASGLSILSSLNLKLYLCKSLLDVVNQVVYVFDTYR